MPSGSTRLLTPWKGPTRVWTPRKAPHAHIGKWDSGQLLKGVTSGWEGEYARLARECRNLAENMRTTRMSYVAQEQQTSDELSMLLHRHRAAV